MSGMTEKLIAEMVKVFGSDVRRINHAMAVLWHAQRIRAAEGGDELVVEAAAILHDIGIHEAERKYNSAAGKYQELEGPPIAAKILERLGIGGEKAEHICCIVGNHHSARDIDSAEFSCIWDADWIVNIPEECARDGQGETASFIDKILRTKTGRETAKDYSYGQLGNDQSNLKGTGNEYVLLSVRTDGKGDGMYGLRRMREGPGDGGLAGPSGLCGEGHRPLCPQGRRDGRARQKSRRLCGQGTLQHADECQLQPEGLPEAHQAGGRDEGHCAEAL